MTWVFYFDVLLKIVVNGLYDIHLISKNLFEIFLMAPFLSLYVTWQIACPQRDVYQTDSCFYIPLKNFFLFSFLLFFVLRVIYIISECYSNSYFFKVFIYLFAPITSPPHYRWAYQQQVIRYFKHFYLYELQSYYPHITHLLWATSSYDTSCVCFTSW